MKKNKFERKKEKWTSKEKFMVILPVLAALTGSFMTYSFSLITAHNQKQFAIQQKQSEIEQKQSDLQKTVYTKVVASGATYAQSVNNFLINKIDTDWNLVYFKLANKKKNFDRFQKGDDRDFSYLSEMTDQRKEFLENLALTQTCFKMDSELQNAIDSLLRFPVADVELAEIDSIKSDKELETISHKKEVEAKKNVDSLDYKLYILTEILKKRLKIDS
jgi:hypothetical protein